MTSRSYFPIVGILGATQMARMLIEAATRLNIEIKLLSKSSEESAASIANIDQLIIVVAAANPEPRRGLIDRFLVSAFTEGITPKIVVTKTVGSNLR